MKKKITALVLSFSIILALAIPARSIDAQSKKVPIIYVHGFMSTDLYVDSQDPNPKLAWPPDEEVILKSAQNIIPALKNFAYTNDLKALKTDVCSALRSIFDTVSLNPDGSIKGTTGIRFSYPAPSEINCDSILKFKYDWRVDPIESASELNKFIDYVLDCSGCEKVAVKCHSLGGIITSTYLSLYGNSKISAVVFDSTAIYGQEYISELMTGEISLTPESIKYYLYYAVDGTEYENLLSGVIDVMSRAGLMQIMSDVGNSVLSEMLDEITKQVLVPTFCCWPSVWAMIKNENIANAEEYIFSSIIDDDNYSGLKSKIDRYNSEIRPYKTDVLNDLNSNASVYVISRYGYSSYQ